MDQEEAYAAAVKAHEVAMAATYAWKNVVREGAMERRGTDPVAYVQDPAYAAAIRIARHQQRALTTLRRYRRQFGLLRLPD